MEKSQLSTEDKKLYDRQIRLFGYETQEKLKNLKVNVFSNVKNISYVAGEILKNFALLGVIDFTVDQITLDSLHFMIPNSIYEINENIKCKIISIETFIHEKISCSRKTIKNSKVYSKIKYDFEKQCDKKNTNISEKGNTESNNSVIECNNNPNLDYKSPQSFETIDQHGVDSNTTKITDQEIFEAKNQIFSKTTNLNENISSDDIEITQTKYTDAKANSATPNKELDLEEPDLLSGELCFFIDFDKFHKTGFYICSHCHSFDINPHTGCNHSDDVDIAKDCLVGAILVQEIVRGLMDTKYYNKWKLSL